MHAKKKTTVRQLLILLTLLPLTTLSQSTDTITSRRFFIGLTFSPDYCYRTLTQNDETITDEQWNNAKNIEDSIDIPKFSYTTGITFGYQINKRFGIETGILYSNKGYRTVSIATIYDFSKPPENARHIINYSYLDIPLKANLTFLDKKLQLLLGIGTTLNILIKTTVKTIPDSPTDDFPLQTTDIDYEYNKINLSPTANIGLIYNINNRMSLRTEPTFRYSVLNIDDKSYKATHFWSVGLNIGFYVGL